MIADGRDRRYRLQLRILLYIIIYNNEQWLLLQVPVRVKYNILLHGRTSNEVVRFPFSDDDGPFDFLKKQTAHNSWPDNNIIYPFADDLLDRDVGDRQRLDTRIQWKHYYLYIIRLGGVAVDDKTEIIVLFSINPFVLHTSKYVPPPPPPTRPCYGGHTLYVLYYYYTYYS